MGDYPIDHHHDKNANALEIDFIQIKVPSYNMLLRSLVTENRKKLQHISVSIIVNGATRLQPVVLCIDQAAGALAAPPS